MANAEAGGTKRHIVNTSACLTLAYQTLLAKHKRAVSFLITVDKYLKK